MLQAILRFCSLEETLVVDAMAALARRRASRMDAEERTKVRLLRLFILQFDSIPSNTTAPLYLLFLLPFTPPPHPHPPPHPPPPHPPHPSPLPPLSARGLGCIERPPFGRPTRNIRWCTRIRHNTHRGGATEHYCCLSRVIY
jgi:hypothetical protein